jgi:hypothetical protein
LVPDSGKWQISNSANFPGAVPGVHQLLFSEDHDGCNLRATSDFIVEEPTIILGAPYAIPGEEVIFEGSGWPHFAAVSIQFPPGHEVARVYDFGNKGNFDATFTLTSDAQSGHHKVIAVAVDFPGWQAEDTFRVIETKLEAKAGPDQTVPGPSPVDVQFDGSGSTGDIVSYQWYNQLGDLRAEERAPVIKVNFGRNPKPGATRTFTLVVEDSQGNKAEDEVTITLGETSQGGGR